MTYHSPLTGTRLQDLIDRRDAQRDTDVKLVARDNHDLRSKPGPGRPVPDRREYAIKPDEPGRRA